MIKFNYIKIVTRESSLDLSVATKSIKRQRGGMILLPELTVVGIMRSF